MWLRETSLVALAAIGILEALGCGGGDDSTDDGAGGTSGSGAGAAGAGAAAGASNATGGASSTGGTASATGGVASSTGGATSGQPVGALCVASEQCDQSGGAAVCCTLPDCSSPCECRLEADCDEGGFFLECASAADCDAFGGGKVCCVAGSMQYCTKPSGCAGETLP